MNQGGRVAVAAIEQVDALVVRVKSEDVRGLNVLKSYFEQLVPSFITPGEHLETATRGRLGSQAYREVVVDENGGEAVVLGD